MVSMRINFLILLWLLLPTSAMADVAESLSYRVYYQGLLSAMKELPIAEARLETQDGADGRLQISTLTLSSAAYDVVDSLYPIRYRLRSLYDRQGGQLVAAERYKRTRKLKHDLVWLDDGAGRVRYLRADAAADARLPPALAPWLITDRFREQQTDPIALMAGLLDRLTLLQALRHGTPEAGSVLTLPVTDGETLFRYEVRQVAREVLDIGGRGHAAWKLRVEGYKHLPDGSEEADHAPIYLWISDDERRLPLRFRMDHAVGDFTVEWVPGGIPVELVLDAPIAEQPQSAWVRDS